MILCCGEALIDFLPVKTTDGDDAFQPHNGGSIYNVAIALGRLGSKAGYFGHLSSDFFGAMLIRGLEASDVDTALVQTSARPSTLAFVNFTGDQAEYAFLDEGSAARMLESEQLPNLPGNVSALHFGSISLINNPAASAFEQLAKREKSTRIISLDPNIRPSVVGNVEEYQARLERVAAMADIIKISDEDLAWLAPDVDVIDCTQRWLDAGCRLVVVTRGAEGATAYTQRFEIEQSADKTTIADTIGAGDAFMAGLLHSLDEQKLLDKTKLHNLEKPAVSNALQLATRAAAITVSRTGANPPWKREI